MLARPLADGSVAATEGEALAALTRYLDAWCEDPAQQGAGYGEEVVVGLDLALRRGLPVDRWVTALGSRLLDWLRMEQALCLPAVARAIVGGLLRETVGLTDAELADGLARIAEAARPHGADTLPRIPPGRAVKRTVSCEYSQFYLEHVDSLQGVPYFQDPREHAQGMSIFPDRAGVGTPTETSGCTIEVKLATSADMAPNLEAAAQAVTFPFTVRGPLVLRSVASSAADDDPFDVAHGEYDVLAMFQSGKRRRSDSLRTFAVTLAFLPRGAFAAPKCLKLEEGHPPTAVFVHERS